MSIYKKVVGGAREMQAVLADSLLLDAVPRVNSMNFITSDAVARAVAGASGEVPQVTDQDNGKVLKAVYDEGGPAVEWAAEKSYSAGAGIAIGEDNSISAPTAPVVIDYAAGASTTEVWTALSAAYAAGKPVFAKVPVASMGARADEKAYVSGGYMLLALASVIVAGEDHQVANFASTDGAYFYKAALDNDDGTISWGSATAAAIG